MHHLTTKGVLTKLQDLDWSLLKGSALISIGTAVARVLGLAYSLVLAAAFPANDYGVIRYAIAVASIVAIGTQPFGQHVFARFVGKHSTDPEKLDSVLSNGFFILPLIFVLTLVIAVPVLYSLGTYNIGILVNQFNWTDSFRIIVLYSIWIERRDLIFLPGHSLHGSIRR